MDFGTIIKVPLRDIWKHEALDFTPWLARNINVLGEVIGLDLELIKEEANCGDFSLDLLAKDLGTNKNVIIENQFNRTDHDHLGKLITYAAFHDAKFVIWIAETIREEHRQALEWLNDRTNNETQFFAIVVEVIKINDSKPAYNFKPIVFPNEWSKSKPQNQNLQQTSQKSERYRAYFQELIDELREQHHFTSAKAGQPQSWFAFASGRAGISYGANFGLGNKVRTELYIDIGSAEDNTRFLNYLMQSKDLIESNFETTLSWEPLEDKRAVRVAIYRDGFIEMDALDLDLVKQWHIKNLLKFKKVFSSLIQQYPR